MPLVLLIRLDERAFAMRRSWQSAEAAWDADPEAARLAELFGRNLRDARAAARLTQAQLAERAGITQQYVSRVESGRQNLTLSTMTALARMVGRDVVSLLGARRHQADGSDGAD
jgi:DNA-binding XRE family transcriptional regulator